MADQEDAKVVDPGLDEQVAKLTPDRIEKVMPKIEKMAK